MVFNGQPVGSYATGMRVQDLTPNALAHAAWVRKDAYAIAYLKRRGANWAAGLHRHWLANGRRK